VVCSSELTAIVYIVYIVYADILVYYRVCGPRGLEEVLDSLSSREVVFVLLALVSAGSVKPNLRFPVWAQCWLRVVCVLRRRPVSGPPCPQATAACLLGLLGRYAAGIRYALEQQALHKSRTESGQAEDEDTNRSVSSIEDDFVTALEHLEEEDPREYSCTSGVLPNPPCSCQMC